MIKKALVIFAEIILCAIIILLGCALGAFSIVGHRMPASTIPELILMFIGSCIAIFYGLLLFGDIERKFIKIRKELKWATK